MIKVLRILLSLMVFFIEVRIRASEAESHRANEALGVLVDEPKDCFSKKDTFPCALKSLSRRTEVKKEFHQLTMSSKAAVVFFDTERLRLLAGDFWFENKVALTLETLYGTISSDPETEFFISVTPEKVVMRVVQGLLKVTPNGHDKSVNIPAGFNNYLTSAGSDGRNRMGIPLAVRPADILNDYRLLTNFGKDDVQKKMESFKPVWKEALETSSRFSKELTDRELAAENAKLEQEKQIELRRQSEAIFLKNLYKSKTFDY